MDRSEVECFKKKVKFQFYFFFDFLKITLTAFVNQFIKELWPNR